ncbi:MAG: 2-oxoglutarate dehydrogenase complex dihydrolipoyllysine-residue succinyltransferase [gamma proteobacterium symbiont of Bathyaustriella thionipta]|nr:2-oxoglutarate dehydrogenase complex dihydrolipoyllysine-residue succinyltransferase [gamma proteobacterium symbiont of Bathyaustriella thionipta]
MSIELRVPGLPESVADANVLNWLKKVGDQVRRDETLVELETDKVVLEVPAPADGVLREITQESGARVGENDLLGLLQESDSSTAAPTMAAKASSDSKKPADAPALSPSVRRLVKEMNLDISHIKGSGKDGRIVKADVMHFLDQQEAASADHSPEMIESPATTAEWDSERPEQRVPMTRLRVRIAERLLQSQQQTASLTTFNEVNLQAVSDLRARYKESFEKKHQTKLGFMSFFTRACVEALKQFPVVNASIDGSDIIYHGYFDIGIAVSSERGLVVPVLRDVDQMSFARIESVIRQYAEKARNGKLSYEELTGGNFTITNGGVFGSMLSTPILNPPQSAILGMHNIQQRAVVEDGEIVIRPMMYLALTYDHRLVDGKDAVQFLVSIKQNLEDPARLLLQV